MYGEKELLELKEQVDEAKTKTSELKGQKTAILTQLKNDFNCKNIKEAEAKLEQMETSIANIEKKIEKGVQELEKKYNLTEDENNN